MISSLGNLQLSRGKLQLSAPPLTFLTLYAFHVLCVAMCVSLFASQTENGENKHKRTHRQDNTSKCNQNMKKKNNKEQLRSYLQRTLVMYNVFDNVEFTDDRN